MQSDLQRYLDGEIGRDELTPESQREADRFELWNRTISLSARDRSPAWLENRIMVSLPARPAAPMGARLVSWLIEPRRIRIRPLPIGLAGATALALALLFALPFERSTLPEMFGQPSGTVVSVSAAQQVYVQFSLSAPQARSVAVAGDFNNWQPDGISLRDPDGDGVWTARVLLRPGQHKYMFLIDGETWVTDPHAERYLDDGYGMRNAVITVAPLPARTL